MVGVDLKAGTLIMLKNLNDYSEELAVILSGRKLYSPKERMDSGLDVAFHYNTEEGQNLSIFAYHIQTYDNNKKQLLLECMPEGYLCEYFDPYLYQFSDTIFNKEDPDTHYELFRVTCETDQTSVLLQNRGLLFWVKPVGFKKGKTKKITKNDLETKFDFL